MHDVWRLRLLRIVEHDLRALAISGFIAPILTGPDMLFVERVEADRLIKLDLRAGDRLPAHAHSLGRVLLAQLSAVQLAEHLPQDTKRKSLAQELKCIHKQGWSFVNSELVDGLFGVAIPLPHSSGVSTAGLNVTSIGEPWSLAEIEQRILPALHESARAIRPITDSLN